MSDSAFSNSFAGDDIFPLRAAPTVSRAQWMNVALRKLGEGFALVQDPTGKRFTFYQPGRPTQACPAHAAKKLLALGLLAVARTNARGVHYVLAESAASQPRVGAPAADQDDTDDDTLALPAEALDAMEDDEMEDAAMEDNAMKDEMDEDDG